MRVVGSNCKGVFSNEFRSDGHIANFVSDKPGVYALWSIGLATSTGNAGHMVASCSSHGSMIGGKHFYLFDPNLGEYPHRRQGFLRLHLSPVRAYASTFLGVRYVDVFEVAR